MVEDRRGRNGLRACSPDEIGTFRAFLADLVAAAIGESGLLVRDAGRDGYRLVTEPAERQRVQTTSSPDDVIEVWMKRPSQDAFDTLMEWAFGTWH